MADNEENKCKCPGCNCFSGLVHVPAEGDYFVINGEVTEILWEDVDDV
jgi:hypothetical protein